MGSVPILSINVNITKDTMLKFDGDANTNVNIDAKSERTFTKQPNFLFRFVTARNSSCGKVMFSQACVIPSVHRVGVGGYPSMQWDGGVCPGGVCPGGVSVQGVFLPGGGGRCLPYPSKTATEASGTHPTGKAFLLICNFMFVDQNF